MSISLTKPTVGSTGWGSSVNQNWTDIENAINKNIMPRGYIDGLILANNATDANNDIDIAIGVARDSTNVEDMSLESSLTKRLDATWAVGNNQGGLDTGSKASSTWYHVWLIKRSDTGVVDALFSTSASSPTMPTSYDRKRRIGAVRTDGSGNILAFVQNDNEYIFKDSILDVNGTTVGTSSSLLTLTVPGGVKVKAVFSFFTSNSGADYGILTPPDMNDSAPLYTSGPGVDFQGAGGCDRTMPWTVMRTNTSSQIRARCTGNMAVYIYAKGWIDPRGANA